MADILNLDQLRTLARSSNQVVLPATTLSQLLLLLEGTERKIKEAWDEGFEDATARPHAENPYREDPDLDGWKQT
jgi:hypothetical protein